MLEVFRSTESLYSYPLILELCEKKYLNKNFTNAFTASVIFLMSHLMSLPGRNEANGKQMNTEISFN